ERQAVPCAGGGRRAAPDAVLQRDGLLRRRAGAAGRADRVDPGGELPLEAAGLGEADGSVLPGQRGAVAVARRVRSAPSVPDPQPRSHGGAGPRAAAAAGGAAPMISPAVLRLSKALLYEGCLLYPYRPSSLKNRGRWSFGGLQPHAARARAECLVEGSGAAV